MGTYPAIEEPIYPQTGINACGLMQVYNEMTVDPEHLERALLSLKRLCHTTVVYDDGSDDGFTREWLRNVAVPSRLVTVLIEGEKNEWTNEIAHKALMLERIKLLDRQARDRIASAEDPRKTGHWPIDWIIWLDADEEFSPGAEALIVEHARDSTISGIRVKELNLWRDRQHYRTDSGFDKGWFLRVWRLVDDMKYEPVAKGLHHVQAPLSCYECAIRLPEQNARVIHYSWDLPEKIIAKIARYRAAGDEESAQRMQDGPHVERSPVSPCIRLPRPLNWSTCMDHSGGAMWRDIENGLGATMTTDGMSFFQLSMPDRRSKDLSQIIRELP